MGYGAQHNIVDSLRLCTPCPELDWFWKQLVWFVGEVAEQRLFHASWTTPITNDWWGADTCLIEFDNMSDLSHRERDSVCFSHWKAVAEAMLQPGIITVSVDKSRVARRDCTLFSAHLPDNRSGWLPPQVEWGSLNPKRKLDPPPTQIEKWIY